MPVFLDTRGRSSLGIAICGRCSRKFPIGELYADPNVPGLRVCRDDRDEFDPYRLPPRAAEDITLTHPRPDTPIATNPAGGLSPATGGLQPWLVLDFVGTQNASLSLDFTARPEGEYLAFATDPSQPTSGFAYYQVWT